MTAIPSADALRTLNLAYRKMQEDFRLFAPDLFRTGSTSLTTDANGYIYLPKGTYEIEGVYDGNDRDVPKIQKKQRFRSSGYYLDGMDTSGGSDDGKIRIMIRSAGAAKASASGYQVDYLAEYDDLSATSDPAYPFTGKTHLDMLTTLQAHFWLEEQGESRHKESMAMLNSYEKKLKDAMLHYQDDSPEYLETTHGDAGSRHQYPYLNVSDS